MRGGYPSRHSFHDSIRDGATPLCTSSRGVRAFTSTRDGIDAAFEEPCRGRAPLERDKITLPKKAASIEVLIKTPSCIAKIAADIGSTDHFTAKVEPEGFKAQVVVFDKASCVASARRSSTGTSGPRPPPS